MKNLPLPFVALHPQLRADPGGRPRAIALDPVETGEHVWEIFRKDFIRKQKLIKDAPRCRIVPFVASSPVTLESKERSHCPGSVAIHRVKRTACHTVRPPWKDDQTPYLPNASDFITGLSSHGGRDEK